jgi:hypothetical protein
MNQTLCALVVALLVSLMPLDLPHVLADDLPNYTKAIKALRPEQARNLVAKFKGQQEQLSLNGLTTLDAATAAALAEFEGVALFLDGLTTLSVDTAKALAKYSGSLVLQGLTTLDVETARSLADAKGKFNVGGLKRLSPEVAKTLAECGRWDGTLFGITAFEGPDSVDVAKALATKAGRLSLPNLKGISPKTLMALLAQEDLEIPSVDTLELIPEPDGSLTEDFVIPDHFRERQRQQERARDAARDARQAWEAHKKALEKELTVDELAQECREAIRKKKWKVAETSLNTMVELDGNLGSQLEGHRSGVRIHCLLEKGDLDSALALARKQYADEKDLCRLHGVAEVMLADEGLDTRLVVIAVEIAEKSIAAELQADCRVAHRHTLARGYFLKGDQAKAAQIVQEAIGFAGKDDEKQFLRSVRDSYRAGKLPDK